MLLKMGKAIQSVAVVVSCDATNNIQFFDSQPAEADLSSAELVLFYSRLVS